MATEQEKLVMGLPSTMNDDYQLSLRVLIERGVEIQPDNEVVTLTHDGNDTHRMTYRQLHIRKNRLACALNKLGIQAGDRIGTFMFNNGRHLMIAACVPCMGAVFHGINFRLHPNELKYIITNSDDKVIFIDSTLLPLFEKIPIDALKNVKKLIICGPNEQTGNWCTSLPNCIDFEVFESSGINSTYKYPNLDEKSAMGLCYTGGTTGFPKGVLYSHRSTFLHTLVALTSDAIGYRSYDCAFTANPYFHVLSGGAPYLALSLGLKYILHNNINDFNKILDFLINEKCSVCGLVPTVMQLFRMVIENKDKQQQNGDLQYSKLLSKYMRAIIVGGSAPASELIKWYNDKGIETIQLWGMTELNPLGTSARIVTTAKDYQMYNKMLEYKQNGNMEMYNKLNDILVSNAMKQGRFVLSVQGKLTEIENSEKIIDNNKQGELIVKGPFVTRTYFNGENNKNESFCDKFTKDGWLKTGDIASINKDSQLIIHDRSKDMIKTGGEWISSVDMENAIVDHLNSIIERACVIGIKHPKWQERPIAVIQLKSGLGDNEVDKTELHGKVIDVLKLTYAKFQLPDDTVIMNEIPLTGPGKVSKKVVRQMLEKENYVLPDLRNKKSKL